MRTPLPWLRVWWVFTLALVAAAPAARAQTLADERVWLNLTAQERNNTPSPWRWYAELQWRYRDVVGAVDQIVMRPAVGYDVTPRVQLWVGYAHLVNAPAAGAVVNENRVWQQHRWAGPAWGGSAQSRTRLEQRAIEGNDRLSWRVRTLARWQTAPAGPLAWAAVFYDEVFLHINGTRLTDAGFDQNRAFAGVGLTVVPGARLEVGYLHQAIHSGAGAPDRRHHVALARLNVTR